ncbi:MAG TPA: hypothetical protein VGI39_22225 [Polyangiaceae bacterium]|jgi:hypothetical protein
MENVACPCSILPIAYDAFIPVCVAVAVHRNARTSGTAKSGSMTTGTLKV